MFLPDHQGSIGVFDSGIGGLSVANAISGLVNGKSMLYVADNRRAPYGRRSQAEVLAYSRQITDFLLGAGCELIVIACNTATSIAIDALRDDHPTIPFVGLEPAVKPAASGQRIGVMATAVTLASDRYRSLKRRYLPEREIWESACPGLVPLVERYGPGAYQIRDYLAELLRPAGALDTVVLGCTHFPLIADDIRAVLPDGVRILDPSEAAARQTLRLLSPGSAAPARASKHRYDFMATGSSLPLQRSIPRLPGLNTRRRWLVPRASVTLPV